MAKQVRGIKVSQLAKELGVPSKAIIDRCKAEGLGDKVPTHNSLMQLGLAETVREWFAQGAGGVATQVEDATEAASEAEQHELAVAGADHAEHGEHDNETEQHSERHEEGGERKHRAPRTRKKKEAAPAEVVLAPDAAPAVAVAEVPAAAPVAEAPAAPAEPETPSAAPAPVIEAPPPEIPVVAAPPAPSELVIEPPAAPVLAPAAQITAPAAQPTAPGKPQEKHAPHGTRTAAGKQAASGDAARGTRPTVTINDKIAAQKGDRKAPPPVVQMLVPKPASIQGPRLVREEKPEIVDAPRKRPTPGQSSQPSYTQARPQTGRGVRGSSDEEGDDAGRKASGGKKPGSLSTRRRGLDGRRGEADAESKIREFTEADLLDRAERIRNATSARQQFDSHLRKTSERGGHASKAVDRSGPIEVFTPVTVKSLASSLGIKTSDILLRLMRKGIMSNINQALRNEDAEALALEFGLVIQVVQERTLEEELDRRIDLEMAARENLAPRPPVVTILGHVDHGKTSLLDKIRSANVAAGEAGGITQHTAAWMVSLGEGDAVKRVTFIDTPGHQAFTSMRARGANMTDVVVLVVSAAEGVQPQTIESINHARAAGVPIVVALNKIDRADANPDMVLGQLAKEGLNPVEWGGETEVVRTSATTGQGIPDLLEILHYQSELLELKADPTARARGTVIEARRDEGMGPVATVLIQDGTLRVGDVVVCGGGFGRVRSLLNDRGEAIAEAGPSTPIVVSGLSEVPGAGDKLVHIDNLELARTLAEDRLNRQRQGQLAAQSRGMGADTLMARINAGDVQTIHLIIKADVQGSAETLVSTVTAQNTKEVQVKVIHSGVGPVNESDVQLAMATRINPDDSARPRKVAIIGFHVVADDSARALAEHHHIDVKTYRVIYEIFDDLKKSLSGMLAPEVREKLHGHAEVRQVYKVSRIGNIAGCMVTDGHISRGSKVRLIRGGVIVTEGLSLESLRRVKDDVKEVKAGLECGIKLAGYDDIKLGDRFEAYIREEFERTL